MRDSHRCHGTIFVALARLLAALEARTARVLGKVYPRRRRKEFIAFVDRMDAEVPVDHRAGLTV